MSSANSSPFIFVTSNIRREYVHDLCKPDTLPIRELDQDPIAYDSGARMMVEGDDGCMYLWDKDGVKDQFPHFEGVHYIKILNHNGKIISTISYTEPEIITFSVNHVFCIAYINRVSPITEDKYRDYPPVGSNHVESLKCGYIWVDPR